MGGFLIGILATTLVLVVERGLLQPNAAAAAEAGGSWLASGLRRLFSPDVAGVPLRSGAPIGRVLTVPAPAVGGHLPPLKG